MVKPAIVLGYHHRSLSSIWVVAMVAMNCFAAKIPVIHQSYPFKFPDYLGQQVSTTTRIPTTRDTPLWGYPVMWIWGTSVDKAVSNATQGSMYAKFEVNINLLLVLGSGQSDILFAVEMFVHP